ncbi:GNAT family N-acetyltransferase [Streptomyces sp. STR69]|uniref:GNAT family N-acetyltransferase n=1 Tax=Streptomyces sp. STR69 TaxID=1796942 RepID=UPI0021CA8960|nr:GNAT family N-acetyltransferase [Streptomyces sp. STR69]
MSVGGHLLQVAGLGGVIVAPHLRGHGLARSVVTAAMEHARGEGHRFGLLFCLPERTAIYRRLGWRLLDEDVLVQQPTGTQVMPLPSMWAPLVDGARWPSGPVHVRSLPM